MKVAFIGHKDIEDTEEIREILTEFIFQLIEEGNDTFLFGSKSAFNSLCYKIVTKLKEEYPHIKRVYVRSMYEKLDNYYEDYLLENYEETFFPEKVRNAGYRSYIKRNQAMIDMCEVLVTYYYKDYQPPTVCRKAGKVKFPIKKKSGTSIAIEYALKKDIEVINIFEIINIDRI